jgi:beta-galactosidase
VAFRDFLRARHGGIDAVNEAWSTEFWSQGVADFAEILPPRATQYLPNPAQELDYRRFLSESLLSHYRQARDLIRAGSGLPITTNFVLGGWVPVDHARWAREVDLVAIDHYPATVATELAERAWAADLTRGWALAAGHEDGRWLLMEHAPGAVFEGGVTRRLAPGAMTEAARAYLDRGAAGVMYFQWRASRGGAEQWHPAMVPHAGPSSRTFTEISALGAEIAGRERVRPRAEIAVIFDEESMWAWQAPHLPTRDLDYTEFAQATHRAASALGAVDVIPVTAPLSGYRLVCVPALYLMTSATHAALREYAVSGGRLLITFGTGLVDGNARVTWDSLADLIGARIAEIGPLLKDERVALDGGGSGTVWCDEIEPVTAEVLTRTEDGAAVLVRSGNVFYLGTRLEGDAYAELIEKIA